MSERIALLGVGVMGRAMALRLLDAGYEVVVVSRSNAGTEHVVRCGAVEVGSPAEAASTSVAVITMLPDSPDVEEVVFAGGLLSSLPVGGLFIDMSTVGPDVARRIASVAAERGVQALDAPVSGGEAGARQGTLSIMVGGSPEAFCRARPLLSILGKHIVHVGPAGAGQTAKAANQVIVAGTIAVVAEALTLARRAGVDPARVREALAGGFADSRILQVHGQRMLEQAFNPGFRIRLQAKDVRLALNLAEGSGMRLRVTPVVAELLDEVMAAGGADLDHSALVLAFSDTVGDVPRAEPG